MTYAEKLKDPRWLCRRQEIIDLHECRCRECGQSREDDGVTLQVHHVFYLRGREPWDYPDELLISVCESCHWNRQKIDDDAQLAFAIMCAGLPQWHVYEVSRGIQGELADGGLTNSHDAYKCLQKLFATPKKIP